MRGLLIRVMAAAMVAAGCSTAGSPATIPPSVPSTVATTTTAVASPPTTSTTTTIVATTTTVDRTAEIEAIFQDLEERRLQALYDGDRDAFKELFANEEYMQQSMALFDLVEFVDGWTMPSLSVVEVLADRADCLAARIEWDHSQTFVGAKPAVDVEVLQANHDGWGFSYAGEGWVCDGPHPLLP